MFSTVPSDFTSSTSTVTIPAGSTSVSVPVTIRDDEINELQESFTAEIANPTAGAVLGTSMATVFIDDNDSEELDKDIITLVLCSLSL